MNAEQSWRAVLGQLQLEMPRASFDTWVKDAEYLNYEDGEFVIGVSNAYTRDWLESRLTSTISRKLAGIINRTVQVKFVVWSKEITDPPIEPVFNREEKIALSPEISHLSSRYSFDSFVVGTSNRLAHAASMAVAERPALAYNPLFLYGGVGLGKTHLLHAIGNRCSRDGLQVLYVSSEEFTNDLIMAIRSQTTQAFREKYRRLDILLIDDIQFIAGKESTQEEFFHTFNTLHGQDKQIVVTSDRPPKAMVTLEERLRSRFEWGLAADIQPPDFETRIAILQSKADRIGYQIPASVIETIATNVRSNIRELEGALTRVTANANLNGLPLTRELAESALVDLLPQKSNVEPNEMVRKVASTFNVSMDQMLGKERARQIVFPRQIAMYLLREEANLSLPQIGEMLGGRDHTTVMHGCKKVAELIETDNQVRRQVMELREKLYGEERVYIRV